jgi:hypothetical protein
MTDTTFIDGDISQSNRIVAAWLNDVNKLRYGNNDETRGAALLQYIPAGPGTPTDVQTFLRSMTTGTVGLGAVNVFTANQSVTPVTLSSTSGITAVNAALSNNFEIVLTENTVLANPTNLTAGMHLFFHVTQHASSPKTFTFDTKYKFSSTDTQVMPTGASATMIIAAYYHATSDTLKSVRNGGTGFA